MHRGRWIINTDFCWLAFRKPSSNLCVSLEGTIVNLVLITCVNMPVKKKESTQLFTNDKLWKRMLACKSGEFLPGTLGSKSLVGHSFQKRELSSPAGVGASSLRLCSWVFTWLCVSVCDLLHGSLGWRRGFEVTLTSEGGDYLFINHGYLSGFTLWWTLIRGWICKAEEDAHIPVDPDCSVE